MKTSLTLVCGLFCMSQCAPAPGPVRHTTFVRGNWVKVSDHPPTFYPCGVRSDCPTDWRSGEWFETGDGHGTRFFIPIRVPGGVSRSALVDQAYSMRSEGKLRQIAAEDQEIRNKFIGYSVVLIPLNCLLGLGGASGVVGVADLENGKERFKERFREQWNEP